jgi:hypothetical protein
MVDSRMPSRLDSRTIARVSGPAWSALRPHIEAISRAVLNVSPTARGDLATSYIKFTTNETGSQPFAVLWVKSSAEIVLGLALPPYFSIGKVAQPSRLIVYSGLTTYLRLVAADQIPTGLSAWTMAAYDNCLPIHA